MWVDLISGHDFFGQALVPRFTAAVADAVARASWNGLLDYQFTKRNNFSFSGDTGENLAKYTIARTGSETDNKSLTIFLKFKIPDDYVYYGAADAYDGQTWYVNNQVFLMCIRQEPDPKPGEREGGVKVELKPRAWAEGRAGKTEGLGGIRGFLAFPGRIRTRGGPFRVLSGTRRPSKIHPLPRV